MMTNILVAGAGKSSTWLIQYLLQHASRNKWIVTVADGSAEAIAEKTNNHPSARAAVMDVTSEKERQQLVKAADIVVSLMPPHLHILLAYDCLQLRKHLITSSYISPEMKALDAEARGAGLMFMCEMGLDPGIDHMTAHQIIHSIQRVAGTLLSFESYCGGLIAPENDTNPWHYKFSWNPKNIIDAGKAGAAWLQDGKEKRSGYGDMFQQRTTISIEGAGNLAWYPNRDSLQYLETYELPDATTFLRATLRHPDFMAGWNALIKLGATDTEATIPDGINTYSDWTKMLSTHTDTSVSVREHVAAKLKLKGGGRVMNMLDWLGLFSDAALPQGAAISGDLLLQILREKWAMAPQDKDMVVMQHEVGYTHRGRAHKLISSMVIKGENSGLTAMAKTVGLPMGILTRMILGKKVTPPAGVLMPNMPLIYKPVLAELVKYGIEFHDQ